MAMLCPRCETKNLSRVDDDQWACFRCGWAEDGRRYPSTALNVEADPRFTSAHVLWRPDAEIL